MRVPKLVLVLALCTGCKNAVIISVDGTMELGYCDSNFLATCVTKFCKDGSYTLAGADQTDGNAVIRCLGPARAPLDAGSSP